MPLCIASTAYFVALRRTVGGRQPSTPLKLADALVVIGIAYLLFIPPEFLERTPLLALAGILLLVTWAGRAWCWVQRWPSPRPD